MNDVWKSKLRRLSAALSELFGRADEQWHELMGLVQRWKSVSESRGVCIAGPTAACLITSDTMCWERSRSTPRCAAETPVGRLANFRPAFLSQA